MIYTTVDRYTVSIASDVEEVGAHARQGVVVHSRLNDEQEGNFIAIGITDTGLSPDLLIEGFYHPGPESGFHPGVLVVSETATAFIGAGVDVLVFSLAPIAEISREQTDCGFWGWRRHGEYVIMAGELELACWSTAGKKIWSKFVEPPWSYSLEADTVTLDVMGSMSNLQLSTGLDISQ